MKRFSIKKKFFTFFLFFLCVFFDKTLIMGLYRFIAEVGVVNNLVTGKNRRIE